METKTYKSKGFVYYEDAVKSRRIKRDIFGCNTGAIRADWQGIFHYYYTK